MARTNPHPDNETNGIPLRLMGSIYEETRRTVFAYALRRLGDPDLADEITSMTYEQAILSRGGYKDAYAVTTWLRSIAGHLIADYLRQQRQRTVQTVSLDALCDDREASFDVAADDDVEADVLAKEGFRVLLDSAAPRQRQALELRFGADYSQSQIAAVMGIAEDTAGKLALQGIGRLRHLHHEGDWADG